MDEWSWFHGCMEYEKWRYCKQRTEQPRTDVLRNAKLRNEMEWTIEKWTNGRRKHWIWREYERFHRVSFILCVTKFQTKLTVRPWYHAWLNCYSACDFITRIFPLIGRSKLFFWNSSQAAIRMWPSQAIVCPCPSASGLVLMRLCFPLFKTTDGDIREKDFYF